MTLSTILPHPPCAQSSSMARRGIALHAHVPATHRCWRGNGPRRHPAAHEPRTVGKALAETVLTSTGAPMPMRQAYRWRCRYRAAGDADIEPFLRDSRFECRGRKLERLRCVRRESHSIQEAEQRLLKRLWSDQIPHGHVSRARAAHGRTMQMAQRFLDRQMAQRCRGSCQRKMWYAHAGV